MFYQKWSTQKKSKLFLSDWLIENFTVSDYPVILHYHVTVVSPPVISRVVSSTWVFPFLGWRCRKFFIPNTLVFRKKVLAEGGGRSE